MTSWPSARQKPLLPAEQSNGRIELARMRISFGFETPLAVGNWEFEVMKMQYVLVADLLASGRKVDHFVNVELVALAM